MTTVIRMPKPSNLSYNLVLNDGDSVSSLDTSSIFSVNSSQRRSGLNSNWSSSSLTASTSFQEGGTQSYLSRWGVMNDSHREPREAFGFRNHRRREVKRLSSGRRLTRAKSGVGRDRWGADAPRESSASDRLNHAVLRPRLPQRKNSEGEITVKRRSREAIGMRAAMDTATAAVAPYSNNYNSSSSNHTSLDLPIEGYSTDEDFDDLMFAGGRDHKFESAVSMKSGNPPQCPIQRRSSVQAEELNEALRTTDTSMDATTSTPSGRDNDVLMAPPAPVARRKEEQEGKESSKSQRRHRHSRHKGPTMKNTKREMQDGSSSTNSSTISTGQPKGSSSKKASLRFPANSARMPTMLRPRQPKPNRQRIRQRVKASEEKAESVLSGGSNTTDTTTASSTRSSKPSS